MSKYQLGMKYNTEKSRRCKQAIQERSKRFAGSLNDKQLVAELGISLMQLHRYLHELTENNIINTEVKS